MKYSIEAMTRVKSTVFDIATTKSLAIQSLKSVKSPHYRDSFSLKYGIIELNFEYREFSDNE